MFCSLKTKQSKNKTITSTNRYSIKNTFLDNFVFPFRTAQPHGVVYLGQKGSESFVAQLFQRRADGHQNIICVQEQRTFKDHSTLRRRSLVLQMSSCFYLLRGRKNCTIAIFKNDLEMWGPKSFALINEKPFTYVNQSKDVLSCSGR